MFGFVFGSLCVVGLMGMGIAARARHHHAHAGFHGGWGHGRARWGHAHGPHGRHEGGRYGFGADGPRGDAFAKAFAEIAKRRLGVDEEQEGIVDHALTDLRAALKDLATAVKATRAPIADAFRGDKVDEATLAAAFGSHDEAVQRARRDVVSSLKQIHAVLTPDQRAKAADWLANAHSWEV